MLAAGLDGIEHELELPPEASNNIYEMSEAERGAAGIDSLPQDLHAAIELAEDTEPLRSALGEHVLEFVCARSGRSGTTSRPTSPRTSSSGTFRSCNYFFWCFWPRSFC